MTLERYDWNVVVIGSWNRAIFTPSWIAKNLFKLPEGSGIEIAVPMDLCGAPLVKAGGVTIKTEEHRLTVGTRASDYEALADAMRMARLAMEELPRTPLMAAGFNIRFRSSATCETLINLTGSPIDESLSDAQYEIVSRGLTRRIRLRPEPLSKGVLNVSIADDDGEASRIELNFHRDSKDVGELSEWLTVDKSVLESQVDEFLTTIGLATVAEK